MIDLNDYFYFAQVVEKQGFTAAADALGLPKSRLSRHVRQLEERLEVRLIQRTSRHFAVTDFGQTFYYHARKLLDEMENAESEIRRKKNSLVGQVSISCSIGIAQFALNDLITQFLSDNPGVNIAQQVANQHTNLIEQGIDLAIRAHSGNLPDSSLIQRSLARVTWHLYAAPAYLESLGTPEAPEDLADLHSLDLGWRAKPEKWQLTHNHGATAEINHQPRLWSEDMGTLKHAACRGLGVVALPDYTVASELASGQLQCVLPEWVADDATVSLVTPSRVGSNPTVQALVSFLISEFPKAVS